MNQFQQFLPTGKLPHNMLRQFIDRYTTIAPDVVIGSKVGEDATVIEFGDKYLVAKTDPITFVTEEIGYYTININANDIACMGGIPRWFLATLLLPERKTTEELVEKIFAQLSDACKQLDIAFCGGHTEITYGIDRPIVIGQMLGEVAKDKLVESGNAKVGDDILLTKGIAIEAVSIIAREKSDELADMFSKELVEQCKNFLFDPGISVLKEAQIAVQFTQVHAMHDPTEGGLSTGLYELARAANVGLKIEYDMIDILPEFKLLCDVYEFDPLGAIASGSLLIVCEPSISHALLEKLEQNGINAAKIGKIMSHQYGLKMTADDGQEVELPYFPQDEIVRLFNSQMVKDAG